MKKSFFSAIILTMLCSCAEPTLEETVKSALETQINQDITEVKIGDTVLAINLKERLGVIDSTLIEYSSNLKKLEATRSDLQISLKETENNLADVSHPALLYGFNETIESYKRTIESYTQMIDSNIKNTEVINGEREQINKQLMTANETIAYVHVSAKVDKVLKDYILSPDLKIIN
tara:strand:+ start:598 stop:1125 length:528 start_codon:yes stop_codon:yes gene_type:complete